MTWLPPIDQDHTELSSRAHASSLDRLALLVVPEARQDLPVPFTRAPEVGFIIVKVSKKSSKKFSKKYSKKYSIF